MVTNKIKINDQIDFRSEICRVLIISPSKQSSLSLNAFVQSSIESIQDEYTMKNDDIKDSLDSKNDHPSLSELDQTISRKIPMKNNSDEKQH